MVSFLGHLALERLSCEAPLTSPVQHIMGVVNPIPGTGPNAQKYVRILVRSSSVLVVSA